MRVTRHSSEHLGFRHVPVGLAIVFCIFVVGGLVAGGCTLAMSERWTLSDDFVQIGAGAITGTLVLGYALMRAALRVRELTFDRTRGSITLESRGLGPPRVRSWELTRLAHGSEANLGTMDPATHAAIARNVCIMNQWLRSEAAAPHEPPRCEA